jgi:hypothetical protein
MSEMSTLISVQRQNHAGGTGETANAASNSNAYSDLSRSGRRNSGRNPESSPDWCRRRGVRRVKG